jgi:hypothetical protein
MGGAVTMQITFFAVDEDLEAIVQAFFEMPGARLVESYSRPDQTNRDLKNLSAIKEIWREDQLLTFSVWSTDTSMPPFSERILFDQQTQRQLAAKGRTVLHNPAFINLPQGREQHAGCLTYSIINAWTEQAARQRSIYADHILDRVHWKRHDALVRKIQRRIKAASTAKFGSIPIMPAAWNALVSSNLKLWMGPDQIDATSRHIHIAEKPPTQRVSFL